MNTGLAMASSSLVLAEVEQTSMTTAEIGALLGVHPSTLHRWKTGKCSLPGTALRWLTVLACVLPDQAKANEAKRLLALYGSVRAWHYILCQYFKEIR